jgi:Na+-transporting methylmalonyl-CoA/oxaloacetate decarboxylase gamma subunit
MRRVVVDPEVPTETADLFRQYAPMLSRIRAGWIPEPPSSASRLPIRVLQVFGALSALVLACLLFMSYVGQVFFFVLTLLTFVVFVGVLAARESPELEAPEHNLYQQARWYEGRYLLPEDFDHNAGLLLDRVQQAIDFILRSQVNAMGMLDDIRNSVILPAQEWEIARLLTKLSALRTEHHDFIYGGSIPEVAAAMAPLERALAASEAAVITRVEALERYASHVSDADRALRAHDQIESLRARLPRYEELLAETGADTGAVPEISRLSEDAGHLEQALRDSVRSAHEAFRHLDGPPAP